MHALQIKGHAVLVCAFESGAPPACFESYTCTFISHLGHVQQNSDQQAASSSETAAHPTGNEATAKWRVYTNLARDLSREVPDDLSFTIKTCLTLHAKSSIPPPSAGQRQWILRGQPAFSALNTYGRQSCMEQILPGACRTFSAL